MPAQDAYCQPDAPAADVPGKGNRIGKVCERHQKAFLIVSDRVHPDPGLKADAGRRAHCFSNRTHWGVLSLALNTLPCGPQGHVHDVVGPDAVDVGPGGKQSRTHDVAADRGRRFRRIHPKALFRCCFLQFKRGHPGLDDSRPVVRIQLNFFSSG